MSTAAATPAEAPGQRRETKAVILAAGKGTRMRSDLPKVLHEVDGRPMIVHVVELVARAGADEIVVIVGYGQDLVRRALEPRSPADRRVRFAVQEEQRGTGHAVLQARPFLESFPGNVLVLCGDMPLLGESTVRSLIAKREETDASAVALTIDLVNPPDFGRIMRDAQGRAQRIVEVKDATPQELAISELNVGAYCFDGPDLLAALARLRTDNRQGEYYLTDVIEILGQDGRRVETVQTTRLEETVGINDPSHLAFANKLADIRYAESRFDLIDAVVEMERSRPRPSGGAGRSASPARAE